MSIIESPTLPETLESPSFHTVQPWETLYGIACKYGKTIEELKRANPTLENIHKIQPGQHIYLYEFEHVPEYPSRVG
jgi:LysM repeat protein